MTNNSSTNESKNSEIWVLRILCVVLLFSLIGVVLGWGNFQNKTLIGNLEYQEKIEKLNNEYSDVSAEIKILEDVIKNSELVKDSIIKSKEIEFKNYAYKSRIEKNNLISKFQKEIHTTISTVVLDTNGIDSINKYVIDCESVKEELVVEKSINKNLKTVIEKKDTALIISNNKFTIANDELKETKKKEARQKYISNFFIGYSVSSTLFIIISAITLAK